MKVVRVKDYTQMSEELNKVFVDQIKVKPTSVVSFTTGKTPAGMAERFVQAVDEGLDISQTIMLNLDEYVGEKEGAYSVHRWMHEHIYNKLTQNPKEIHMMDAGAEDQQKEVDRYKALLERYPRDLQMLGLGTNGHIGANEPGTPFDASVFVADSYESTIQATKDLFDLTYEETPKQMFTMGFTEIMEAKCVVLAASGKAKAEAVKNVIEGPITEDVPASFLRNHDNFIFIIDDEAASLLTL